MRLALALFLAISIPGSAYTSSIIDFIITNNPDLQELKRTNKNILNFMKIEAKGNTSYGQMQREGTSSIDRTQYRYDIGISASIPLISPKEKAQRRIEEAEKERTLRLDVINLLIEYRNKQKAVSEDAKILKNLYNEIQWIGKRVEAGVDHQKDYNQKLHSYLNEKKKHEIEKEQVNLILEKILSYVYQEKREKLKEMINENIPEYSTTTQ